MLGRVCTNSYMADNSASLHVTPVLRHMLKKFADIVVFIRQAVILKPHSHCADVATVHTDTGQPVYRDAPGHIS